MQSTIQLYNTALARLGGDQLEYEQSPYEQSIGETNTLIALCNNLFPHVLDTALSAHAWSFAVTRRELAERIDKTPSGPEHPIRYALPGDCLRPVRLESRGAVNGYPAYVVEGTDVLTAASPACLVYVARVAEPARWPAPFADALAWGLACELATARINDPRRQQMYRQEYERSLHEAMARDRNTQRPARARSGWLAARGNVGADWEM